MSTVESAKIYDAFAKHYREYSEKKNDYIKGVDGLIMDYFKNKIESVFDFGAGDGVRGASVFKNLGAKTLVSGDISQEMIQRCRDLKVAEEVWDLSKDDWKQSPRRFDLVVSLWNVFGHIPNMEMRVDSLKSMAALLKPNGKICFDVNNRHNQGYGKYKVQWRRFIDWIKPDYTRGDVQFDWKIDGKSYPAHGHLFTKAEVKDMLTQAGLKIVEWKTVDYMTGEISSNVTQGQYFFIVEKR